MSRFSFSRPVLELSFVACVIADASYVIPISKVREITQPMRLTRVPEAPQAILGAVDHRGEVVPIVDLGFQVTGRITDDPRRKWILLRNADRTLGIVVRQVFEVFRTPEVEVRMAPEMGGSMGYSTREVVRYDGAMAFVLDVDSVFQLALRGPPVSALSLDAPRGAS
mgnify:CR=1 FL=1